MPPTNADIVVVGGGAAGLMAAVQAARSTASPGGSRIVLLDGAKSLGAKILVAGGGRCNVTHHQVEAADFNGGSRNAIAKVLRAFPVEPTIAFFKELGVDLKREETGKLFPTTDKARTVLDALTRAAIQAGVEIRTEARVDRLASSSSGFQVGGPWGEIEPRRVVLATGGKSLPKTGSDGFGYELARRLGHTLTERVTPALVPLLLPTQHLLTTLPGLSCEAGLEIRTVTGKRLHRVEGSLLLTHFGLSGPAALDVSRHWIDAHLDDPRSRFVVDWLPALDAAEVDAQLRGLGPRSTGRWLTAWFPERLVLALCELAGADPSIEGHRLDRPSRQQLVRTLKESELPIVGDRGYTYAEVTAGGVPLAEIDLATMESRIRPGLHLCGEILDVDGRIGGFNFQWAWASGTVAGKGASH